MNVYIVVLILFLSTACRENNNIDMYNVTVNQKIIDSEFKYIKKEKKLISKDTIKNNSMNISNNWIVKSNNVNGLSVIAKNVDEGLKLILNYEDFSYIYIRQIIQNIYFFENKTIEVEVNYTMKEDIDLNYDIYIQSRFNSNNNTRIIVADTEMSKLNYGKNKIIRQFKIPEFNNKGVLETDSTEGLSVAFRLIGENLNSDITIHSIKLNVLN